MMYPKQHWPLVNGANLANPVWLAGLFPWSSAALSLGWTGPGLSVLEPAWISRWGKRVWIEKVSRPPVVSSPLP